MNKELFLVKIKGLADSAGIDVLGFADAAEFSGYELKNHNRRDPRLAMPDAETIIIAGMYIGGAVLPKWQNPWYGRTSRLFLSEYFLDVVKPLKPIVKFINNEGYQAMVCHGGSILPLKLAAIRAGLGWQGKHSLLISRAHGSFLALGGIVTNLDLAHNTRQEPDRCGNCDKCQKACPVAALKKPYVLDRKKCMSSLLQQENLPSEVHKSMENRVADCEICQDACLWNKKHLNKPQVNKITKSFQQKIENWQNFFYLPDLANLSEKGYQDKLGCLDTGIPYNVFQRNVLIALKRAKKIGDQEGTK